MTKIFKQAKDKNVAKVIVYGHTDSFLYSDAAHTTKLNKSELKDLFLKGCLIKTASGDLTPVKYLEAETYTGFVAKTDAASASYYSDGYVAPTPPTPSWTELWSGSVEFEEDEEEVGVIYASPDRGESTMISHIFNTTDDYKVEITDLSLSIEGKFVAGEGGTCELGDYNLVTTDIDFSVANVEMYSASFFDYMYAKSSSVGEHTVKISKKVTS